MEIQDASCLAFAIKKRRRRDLNPRAGATDLLVFEARPFSLLGTSPYFVKYIIYYSAFFGIRQ